MSGSLTATPPDEDLTGIVDDPNDLTTVLGELAKAKKFKADTEEAIKRLDARAQELLAQLGRDAYLISDPTDGEKKTAKIIRGEDTVVDVDAARELLGQEILDKVLAPPKVSAEKWEHACEVGDVPIEVAAQVVTYKPKKPYVRFFKAD